MRNPIATLIPILLVCIGLGCGDQPKLTQTGPRGTDTLYRMGPVSDPGQAEGYSADAQAAFITDQEATTSVLIELANGPVPAGTPTAYHLTVMMAVWDVTESFETELEVRPMAGVTVNPDNLIFTTPGNYELIATATQGDITVKGSREITVVVGPPVSLTVEAVPETAEAGEEVTFTLAAVDVAGNPIDPASLEATLTLQPIDQAVDPVERSVVLTIPGRYEIHAEASPAVTDIDVFYVTPGDPATLDLVLDEHGILDPSDTLDYEVNVADEYGNPIEVHGALVFTDPATGTEVEARRIRFLEEGIYQVFAGIPGSELEDSEGPVVVDGYGPDITITSPERGSVQTYYQVTVTGSVTDTVTGVERVELNGEAITLGRGGSFSVTLDVPVGVNLIEIAAWDGAGHESSTVQSFLYGYDFVASGEQAPTTLVGRVNQGTLDMIEDYVEGEFNAAALRALVMANPRLFYYYYDFWIDDGHIWADVQNFSVSSVRLELIPRSGYVELQAYVYDVYVYVHVDGDSWYVPSIYGTVTADWAKLTGHLALGVNNGNITANLTDVNVEFRNSALDIDGIPDLLSFIEDWIWDYAEDKVREAVIDAVTEQAPPAIDDYLSDLEIPRMPIDMYGKRLWFEVIPRGFAMQTTGINMYLDSIVEPNTVHPDYADGPGALFTWSWIPSYASTPGFILSVGDDFLNQALNAIWETDLIDAIFQAEGADSLDLSFLTMFVPEATDFEIEIDPLLPPVFIVGQKGDALGEIQAGDMLVDVYAVMGNGTRSLMAQVALSAFAGVRFGITDDNMAEFEIVGDPEFYFDGLISTIPNLTDEGIETLLEALVPVLVPSLIEGVQQFPLPAFEGLTINNPGVGLAGGFINLSGNLVLQ